MESREYKVWFLHIPPEREILIIVKEPTEQNISDIENFINCWPESKIPYKTFIKFLRCNNIFYEEKDINGQFRKTKS